MRISDWSSDVCSSDLRAGDGARRDRLCQADAPPPGDGLHELDRAGCDQYGDGRRAGARQPAAGAVCPRRRLCQRSEEHTSELQSLMRISYAVFCLKKKTHTLHLTNSKLTNTYTPPTHPNHISLISYVH